MNHHNLPTAAIGNKYSFSSASISFPTDGIKYLFVHRKPTESIIYSSSPSSNKLEPFLSLRYIKLHMAHVEDIDGYLVLSKLHDRYYIRCSWPRQIGITMDVGGEVARGRALFTELRHSSSGELKRSCQIPSTTQIKSDIVCTKYAHIGTKIQEGITLKETFSDTYISFIFHQNSF